MNADVHLQANDEPYRIYEQPALRDALDDVLRPGGLALTDAALAASHLAPGALVLDVGCGAGVTVEHLRIHHGLIAAGIDASELLLDAGHGRTPELPLLQGIGQRLPIAAEMLDAVLAECSLSLMADVDAALAEFWRVLKPGGRLIVADLYLRNVGSEEPCRIEQPGSCLEGALPRVALEQKLAGHKFELTAWQDCTDALKVLAAQLILAGISPAQFWRIRCESPDAAIARLKPGYFWLVACKPGCVYMV